MTEFTPIASLIGDMGTARLLAESRPQAPSPQKPSAVSG
jgi:hypothetical protein